VQPGRIYVGLLLVGLGVIFLLDRAGTLEAGETLRQWWPAALIGLGLVQLIERPRSVLGPAIFVIAGVVLLLFTLDLIQGSALAVIWPVALIALGLIVLFRHGRGRGVVAQGEDGLRASAIFGGHEVSSRSRSFKGGSATALFGGVELDLRQAQLDPEGARLDVSALFGGVDILVPRGWRVQVQGTPIFGGVENKAEGEAVEVDSPELVVDALAIFGGVDVKHEK
jgi:predicted membrane protein